MLQYYELQLQTVLSNFQKDRQEQRRQLSQRAYDVYLAPFREHLSQTLLVQYQVFGILFPSIISCISFLSYPHFFQFKASKLTIQ